MAAANWHLALFSIFIAIGVATGGDGIKVVEITDSNWGQVLSGKWLIIFTSLSPTCEICTDLQPIWERYSKWSGSLGIQVGQVDVPHNPTISGKFMVKRLLQSYYLENGTFRHFQLPLTKPDLFLYLENQSFEKVEPIPNWRSPGSPLISLIFHLLQLSEYLQASSNHIKQKFGVSSTSAYLIFGLETFVFGFLLGFTMVLLFKLLSPRKLLKVN
ncbi:Thioredoxin-related transmembrane protein 1 [Orchesella cincta]|uniref:Thioredoxin-related transmembrane protein 1 n=1 Tax=Orchesella cincta TaxID=48709 RepID=A0A1D2NHT7_ORCCI|nr:Thioredoxin-related transmembrane protein 1 [Orchesella cincta]